MFQLLQIITYITFVTGTCLLSNSLVEHCFSTPCLLYAGSCVMQCKINSESCAIVFNLNEPLGFTTILFRFCALCISLLVQGKQKKECKSTNY